MACGNCKHLLLPSAEAIRGWCFHPKVVFCGNFIGYAEAMTYDGTQYADPREWCPCWEEGKPRLGRIEEGAIRQNISFGSDEDRVRRRREWYERRLEKTLTPERWAEHCRKRDLTPEQREAERQVRRAQTIANRKKRQAAYYREKLLASKTPEQREEYLRRKNLTPEEREKENIERRKQQDARRNKRKRMAYRANRESILAKLREKRQKEKEANDGRKED